MASPEARPGRLAGLFKVCRKQILVLFVLVVFCNKNKWLSDNFNTCIDVVFCAFYIPF